MKTIFNLRFFKFLGLIGIKIISRNKKWLIFGAAIFLLLLISQIKFNFFYNPNSISLGFIGTYEEHDLPDEVTKLLSKGLVKSDAEGRIKPNLVAGWETNNDATSFKFKLTEDLRWIDNSSNKSDDLFFTIPNVEVKTPSDKEIQFNLKESYSPFPSLLTKPILKKGSLLGTGPYKIEKLERSRIFITKLTLTSKDPNLPKIIIRFYPNEKVAVAGFNLGEVQALFGFSNPRTFSDNPRVNLSQSIDYSKIVTVLFQTKDALLSNRSLRQALAFKTPKIEGEEIANNPYPKNLWAFDASSKKYLDNPEEAKSALERAKSQLSEDKLHQELILTVTPNLEEVGNKVVGEWKGLGLNVKIRVESGIPQNFQSLLITQSIPKDPDQYVLWHATQEKTNLSKYDSKRVDKDLEDGRKLILEEDRKAKYFDFQKTLLEDAPAVFLYFPKYNIAYLKKKEGVLKNVLSLDR